MHCSVMQVGMFFNVLSVRFLLEEKIFSGHLCWRCCQPEDRQSSTGSAVVTATCATTPLSQCTTKTKQNNATSASVHTTEETPREPGQFKGGGKRSKGKGESHQ